MSPHTFHQGPNGTVHAFTINGLSLCKRVTLGLQADWPQVAPPWLYCGHCYKARLRMAGEAR